MKRIAPFLLLSILISCKEVSFREPQPKGRKILTTVPKELHGKYLPEKDDGGVSKDTIVITAKGYRFGYYDPADQIKSRDKFDDGNLGDSLILKSFKGYYFLNFNERPEWLLRVFKRQSNGDLIYMTPEQEGIDFKDYIKNLSKEIRIDSVKLKDEVLYQIDPTPRQLVSLIEKGYFSRTILRRVK
jgi:hypothetical protein